jgi:murein L,D-transpeptidase YafK
MSRSIVLRLAAAAGAGLSLTGCLGLNFGFGAFGGSDDVAPAIKQLPAETQALLALKGMRAESPMFVRIFKEESEFEIWKAKDDGRFYHFRTYPICAWSGTLGPKVREGDKQAPEGFYAVSARQLNPHSLYHLSFNLGFPNSYDRANGRTGGALMVHGNCKSAGCYAMTDALIEEIYLLARESFRGGQQEFQVQALPFRMTQANMARHQKSRWYGFWRRLKEGYDYFEFSHVPPKVAVCHKNYMINVAFNGNIRPDPAAACPMYAKIAPEPRPLHGPGPAAPILVAKFPSQDDGRARTASAPPRAPKTPEIRTAAAARPAARVRPAATPVVAAAPAQRAPRAAAARSARPAPRPRPQQPLQSEPVVASVSPEPQAPSPRPRRRFEPVQNHNANGTDGEILSNMNPAPGKAPPQPAAQPRRRRPSVAQMAAQPGDTTGRQRVLKGGKSDKLGPATLPPPPRPEPEANNGAQQDMLGYAPTGR